MDAYVDESFEGQIVRHLVIYPVRCNGIVRDILHISVPEVQGGIEHSSGDTTNMGMLLALDFMKVVNQFLVMFVKVFVVVEDFINELIKSIASDDWRFCRP